MKLEHFQKYISVKINRVIKDSVGELTAQIREEAPVASGKSRAGYKMTKTDKGWAMTNDVTGDGPGNYNYVVGLWNGLSRQLPQGHFPTLIKWRATLMQNLKELDI